VRANSIVPFLSSPLTAYVYYILYYSRPTGAILEVFYLNPLPSA